MTKLEILQQQINLSPKGDEIILHNGIGIHATIVDADLAAVTHGFCVVARPVNDVEAYNLKKMQEVAKLCGDYSDKDYALKYNFYRVENDNGINWYKLVDDQKWNVDLKIVENIIKN